jgi:hypothetical protein
LTHSGRLLADIFKADGDKSETILKGGLGRLRIPHVVQTCSAQLMRPSQRRKFLKRPLLLVSEASRGSKVRNPKR